MDSEWGNREGNSRITLKCLANIIVERWIPLSAIGNTGTGLTTLEER